MLNQDKNKRMELKYRISYFDYLKIRSAIRAYMKKDPYTKLAKGKGYTVCSLYYDTYDYSLFFEKMSGDSERVRYRLRTYNEDKAKVKAVRVELKVRKGNHFEKYSTFVSLEDYEYFIRHRRWLKTDHPILTDFEHSVHLRELRPKTLVRYYREGYQSRKKEDLRITFDHRVSSAQAVTLFPGHLFFKMHHPQVVVMEIKFKKDFPAWLHALVQSYGLRVVANSKFTQSISVARYDLHYPERIVVVR